MMLFIILIIIILPIISILIWNWYCSAKYDDFLENFYDDEWND